MLPAVVKSKAFNILDKVRQDFETTVLDFNGDKINTTVSMGMIEIKPEKYFQPNFVDDYIMIADKKLYIAKNNGRNRIEE